MKIGNDLDAKIEKLFLATSRSFGLTFFTIKVKHFIEDPVADRLICVCKLCRYNSEGVCGTKEHCLLEKIRILKERLHRT